MKKIIRNCSWCGAEIMRYPINHNTREPIEFCFCNNNCKGNWQRENQKPEGVTKEWLIQKYEVEQFDCAEIGRMVGRDTKSVWNWLIGYGIKTRRRGSSVSKQWARGDRKAHGLPHSEDSKEKIRQARLRDGRVPYLMPDGSHYMKGRRGEDHHAWKGGVTPERERIFHTDEWKELVKKVWSRSDAKCERCGKDHRKVDNRQKDGFHIHHIAGFSDYPELRCALSNLALLCRPCHHFVHSRRNEMKEFIHVAD